MSAGPADRAIAFANRASGGGGDEGIDEWCARLGMERRDGGDDLAAAIAAAAAERPSFIAVVGGDGTVRTAAAVLSDGDVPLLVAPTGTFNHFAKWLGIDDLDVAAAAARDGMIRTVPVPQVNDEVFLNTCAVGWYPEMVQTRERLRRRVPRPVAAVVAGAVHAFRLRRFDVDDAGSTRRVWLLWAGNGRFGTNVDDLTERQAGVEDVLDVRLALDNRSLPRLRAAIDLVRGRLKRSEGMARSVIAHRATVTLDRDRVLAALDAEVVQLRSPLVLIPAARRLQVVVPAAT